MQATGNQEARARQRALNFRKRFGCLGQARGLAAKAAWKARGCMGQNVSSKMSVFPLVFRSSIYIIWSRFPSAPRGQISISFALHICQCFCGIEARTCAHVSIGLDIVHAHISCTEIGTRSVCCTIIAFFPHIPAGIQGTVSERQLSLQEQYIDNFISSYIVVECSWMAQRNGYHRSLAVPSFLFRCVASIPQSSSIYALYWYMLVQLFRHFVAPFGRATCWPSALPEPWGWRWSERVRDYIFMWFYYIILYARAIAYDSW